MCQPNTSYLSCLGPQLTYFLSEINCFESMHPFFFFIFGQFLIVLRGYIAVSVECVNICNLTKGDGNVRSDCNALSCAWKAPRALTGFLASTAHPPVCSLYLCGRSGRKSRVKSVIILCSFCLCS